MCSSIEPVPSEYSSEEDDVIEKLQEYICYIETLKADGYELIDSIDDDYGFVRKTEK